MNYDAETFTTTGAGPIAKPVTFESVGAMLRELEKYQPPPINRDQCKMCGCLLGTKFGGLIDVPEVPVYFSPLPGVPYGAYVICYVCPACWEMLKAKASRHAP